MKNESAVRKQPDNKRPILYVLFKKYGLRGALSIVREDIGFDIRNFTNTAAPVGKSRLFDSSNQANQNRYVASTFGILEAVIEFAAKEIDLTQCGFVDLGSGKGKALIAATRFPFASIRGIEISSVLHKTASRNIVKLGLSSEVELINDSAINLQFQSHERIIYFFNSFTGDILEKCLTALSQSEKDGPGLLIYVNPTEHHQVQRHFSLISKVFFQPGNCEVNFYTLPAQ